MPALCVVLSIAVTFPASERRRHPDLLLQQLIGARPRDRIPKMLVSPPQSGCQPASVAHVLVDFQVVLRPQTSGTAVDTLQGMVLVVRQLPEELTLYSRCSWRPSLSCFDHASFGHL